MTPKVTETGPLALLYLSYNYRERTLCSVRKLYREIFSQPPLCKLCPLRSHRVEFKIKPRAGFISKGKAMVSILKDVELEGNVVFPESLGKMQGAFHFHHAVILGMRDENRHCGLVNKVRCAFGI